MASLLATHSSRIKRQLRAKKISCECKSNKKRFGTPVEILAEPIQTVMKRHGIQDSYEALKELTRGHSSISRDRIAEYINDLPIPEGERENYWL